MTKEEFSQLVSRAVEAGMLRQLAIEYGIAESTVKRWISGVARPLPRLMDVIAAYIKSNGVE